MKLTNVYEASPFFSAHIFPTCIIIVTTHILLNVDATAQRVSTQIYSHTYKFFNRIWAILQEYNNYTSAFAKFRDFAMRHYKGLSIMERKFPFGRVPFEDETHVVIKYDSYKHTRSLFLEN